MKWMPPSKKKTTEVNRCHVVFSNVWKYYQNILNCFEEAVTGITFRTLLYLLKVRKVEGCKTVKETRIH